mmetsp:Transcript_2729/g.5442  ORF Transcript_2729/g.5442 Transcript_2729/m.5442 type:complete len:223 (-) Transcript_2729:259-927(-)
MEPLAGEASATSMGAAGTALGLEGDVADADVRSSSLSSSCIDASIELIQPPCEGSAGSSEKSLVHSESRSIGRGLSSPKDSSRSRRAESSMPKTCSVTASAPTSSSSASSLTAGRTSPRAAAFGASSRRPPRRVVAPGDGSRITRCTQGLASSRPDCERRTWSSSSRPWKMMRWRAISHWGSCSSTRLLSSATLVAPSVLMLKDLSFKVLTIICVCLTLGNR